MISGYIPTGTTARGANVPVVTSGKLTRIFLFLCWRPFMKVA
jgi:hypothetical protein